MVMMVPSPVIVINISDSVGAVVTHLSLPFREAVLLRVKLVAVHDVPVSVTLETDTTGFINGGGRW